MFPVDPLMGFTFHNLLGMLECVTIMLEIKVYSQTSTAGLTIL